MGRGMRNFLYSSLMGLSLFSGSCSGGGGGRHAPQNEIPRVLSLERSFKNDGMVYYKILGEDPDGLVVRIETVYNGEIREHMGSDASFSEAITQEGEHVLEVRIFDNDGGIGYSEDRFKIPHYGEAFDFIKTRLDEDLQRGGFLEFFFDNPSLSLPDGFAERDLYPDFLITRKDDPHDSLDDNMPYAIVDYVGVDEDLAQKQEDHRWLHELQVPHVYLFRMPLRDDSNLDSERLLKTFIDSGYRAEIEE